MYWAQQILGRAAVTSTEIKDTADKKKNKEYNNIVQSILNMMANIIAIINLEYIHKKSPMKLLTVTPKSMSIGTNCFHCFATADIYLRLSLTSIILQSTTQFIFIKNN